MILTGISSPRAEVLSSPSIAKFETISRTLFVHCAITHFVHSFFVVFSPRGRRAVAFRCTDPVFETGRRLIFFNRLLLTRVRVSLACSVDLNTPSRFSRRLPAHWLFSASGRWPFLRSVWLSHAVLFYFLSQENQCAAVVGGPVIWGQVEDILCWFLLLYNGTKQAYPRIYFRAGLFSPSCYFSIITTLTVRDSSLQFLPSEMTNLNALQELDISRNSLVNIDLVTRFPSLVVVNAAGNQVSSLSAALLATSQFSVLNLHG